MTAWRLSVCCWLASTAGLPLLPAAALAELSPPCAGTLLQLQLEERGSAAFDRFRFDLGLDAEAPSKAEAMAVLNRRLAGLREALRPLQAGELTIPAPTTYRSGGGSGPGAQPVREHAGTTVSGEVSKARYDALIQAAGRLPGVTLRGITAQAAAGAETDLQTALMQRALARGRRQAEITAQTLGLARARLLRIDQRQGVELRPMPYARMAAAGFNPEEAPPPERSVSLGLDYCLSS